MRIAVIIPAHNEQEVIESTIDALWRAKVQPADVYVVDDASSDKTSAIAAACGVQLLTLTTNLGKSGALNAVIQHFKLCENYDYIAFLDADTKVREDYFQVLKAATKRPTTIPRKLLKVVTKRSPRFAATLKKVFSGLLKRAQKPAIFLGQVKSQRGGYITALRTTEYQFGHDLYKMGQTNWGTVFVAPGCASMYRADVLSRLRYAGDTLAEDMDLTIQVQRMREKIEYVPGAIVYTQDPATFKDLMRQVKRWQRGGWQVVRKHRIFPFMGERQPVDVMLFFMMGDALLLNRYTVFIPLMLFLPKRVLLVGLCVDACILISMALYSGIKNRRADVVYKLPLYFWIFYVMQFTYIQTFFEVMFSKKGVMDWSRVQRYAPAIETTPSNQE